MAGLMPAGRSRSLGGFDVPKEPAPSKQARLCPIFYPWTCTLFHIPILKPARQRMNALRELAATLASVSTVQWLLAALHVVCPGVEHTQQPLTLLATSKLIQNVGFCYA